MKRKSYPEYKPSGVEWLEEIPKHWQMKRLKHHSIIKFSSVDKHTLEGEQKVRLCNYIDVYHHEHITQDLDFMEATATIEEAKRFAIKEGDVLATKDSEEWNDIAVAAFVASKMEGVLCGYHLALVRANPDQMDGRYLFRAFSARGINDQFRVEATGITRYGLSKNSFGDALFPLPSLDEQRAITTFLYRETERIDALIEKKEKQSELLREKRFALIHNAIQDAGTRTLRLGHVAYQVFRAIHRKDDELYVPIGLYNLGRGIFHKEPTLGADLGDSDFFTVKAGDLVLSGQFSWEGAVALAGDEDTDCVATHRFPILLGKPALLNTAYLWAFLTSSMGDFLLNEHARGAAGRNRPLNVGTLLKEAIPIPPMEAQLRISKHVFFEQRFNKTITNSINHLSEYRLALISAIVTGKIDVREAGEKRN